MQVSRRIATIVIGGGQAGLSVGYHLQRLGVPFVILDAAETIGGAWRSRWDSLRLFTPARYDGLDGKPFPAPSHAFPTKDEMADYLEAYSAEFALPVRSGQRVTSLSKRDSAFIVETDDTGSRRTPWSWPCPAGRSADRGLTVQGRRHSPSLGLTLWLNLLSWTRSGCAPQR